MPNTQNQPENPGKDAFVAEMGRDAEYETDVGEIEYAIIFESQSLDSQSVATALRQAGLSEQADKVEKLDRLFMARDYALEATRSVDS